MMKQREQFCQVAPVELLGYRCRQRKFLRRALGCALPAGYAARAQTLTTLATFNGANGAGPYLGLTLGGSTLYGVTQEGGSSNDGTVFSLPVTGGTATTLYTFSGSDGQWPLGNLVLSGSTLYGATDIGGANNRGTVFSLPTSGGPLTTLFTCTQNYYGPNSLILSGSNLYAMTGAGGVYGDGSVFSLSVTGGADDLGYVQRK